MRRLIARFDRLLRAARRLVGGEPDLSSQASRAAERHRRVALSALSSSLAWATSVAAGLVIVPLVLHHLGSELYGVFATITAIAGLVGWADFGIGNGLTSEVADADGRSDRASVAQAVSTAFFTLLLLSVALAVLLWAVYPFVPWPSIFNVSGAAANDVGAATAAFVGGILLALPLGVVQRAEIGLQEMFVASGWQALGTLLGLGGAIVAVSLGASLPYLVLVLSVAPAVAMAGNGAELFYRRRGWLRPTFRRVDRATAGRLLRIGSMFFVLQVAVAVAYESDALVLTQILGPSSVTAYSITMRVFLVVPTFAGFVLAPLWPAYGEAISRGDAQWVRRTLRRALRAGLLLSVTGATILALVARPFIHVWAGFRPRTSGRGGRHLDDRDDDWSRPRSVPQRCSRDPPSDRSGAADDDGESGIVDRLHTVDWSVRSRVGLNRGPGRSHRDHVDRHRSTGHRTHRSEISAALAELTLWCS